MATRGRGEALIRAKTRASRSAAQDLERKGRSIRGVILSEFRGDLSRDLESAMVDAAPRGKKPTSVKPGPRLHETIKARVNPLPRGVEVNVYTSAVDPHSGYHYTGVTRFGHRKRIIRPLKRKGRGVKSLRFWSPRVGGFVNAPKVKGVRHSKDWVQVGMVEADRAADKAADRIGRRIVTGVRR